MFDVVRKARALGVPVGPPKAHPFNPLLALRAASVLPQLDALLREGTPTIDRETLARWSALRPSAERRQR